MWVTAPAMDASGQDRVWSPLKAARSYDSTDVIYKSLTPKDKTRTLPNGCTETWDDEIHKIPTALIKFGSACDHCLMV